MASAGGEQPIIIKKKKVSGHGHHGGAWKVAYADFVTAMMAFFLLLWLLGSTSKEDRQQIQAYFKDPTGSIAGQGGGLDAPGMGNVGPGGANQGMINWDNPLTQPQPSQDPLAQSGVEPTPPEKPPEPTPESEGKPDLDKASDAELAREQAEREQNSLNALQQDLEKELSRDDSAFVKLRDQILIDQTALGLRIQIVDKENRPMFAQGSPVLESYTRDILHAIVDVIKSQPNRISISGHTDKTPYSRQNGYSNWELSADRANAARRELVASGLEEDRIGRVVGLSSSVLFDKENPYSPINRRISIIVMTKAAEQAVTNGEGASVIEPPAGEIPDAGLPPPADKAGLEDVAPAASASAQKG